MEIKVEQEVGKETSLPSSITMKGPKQSLVMSFRKYPRLREPSYAILGCILEQEGKRGDRDIENFKDPYLLKCRNLGESY
jgi:hypothetical protein